MALANMRGGLRFLPTAMFVRAARLRVYVCGVATSIGAIERTATSRSLRLVGASPCCNKPDFVCFLVH